MAKRLLEGVRVAEIADARTEYAGRALAELGAEVFLIEPPGGSPTRARHPYAEARDESRRSLPFIARNANKKSVLLDLGEARDREAAGRLLAAADIVLAPEGSPFLDLQHAGQVPVSVTVADPDALGTSSVVNFAASCGLSSSGWSHQPPCNAPSWLALDAVAIYVADVALVGLWMVRHGTPRAHFTVYQAEAALAGMTPWTRPLVSYEMTVAGQGIQPARTGAGPYPIYRCADGSVRVLAGTPRQWHAFRSLLGDPEELAGPEWDVPGFRAQNFDAIYLIGSERTRKRSRDDLFHEGQRLGLTISPVLSVAEFLADPHVASREYLLPMRDPDHGELRLPRAPYRFPKLDLDQTPRPAPSLGEHTAEIGRLRPRRASSSMPRRQVANTSSNARPLAGIRVLEMGVGAVIPELCSMMALLGAEVIKIESRRYVDFLRQSGLAGRGDHNGSPTFNQLNLGVLSCAVDMTHEPGRELVRRLAAHCDVVMENMRGDVVKKWGLDYETVRRIRPDTVYLSSQGLGEGRYGGYQTFGPNLQTFSGVTSLWAHPDDPYPAGTTLNHPDHLAGKQALLPVLAALMRRDETGEGAFIDAAQFESAAALIVDKLVAEQVIPGSAIPLGNRSLDDAPHGCYPCRGDDEWCALAVCDEAAWSRFQALVGERWVEDPRFETAASRLLHVDELDACVAAWTRKFSATDLEVMLRSAGVDASRIVSGADLAASERDHGGIFAALAHPTAGTRWYTGLPFVTSASGRPALRRAPLLGEHTEYVLYDILQLNGERVSELTAAGVVGF